MQLLVEVLINTAKDDVRCYALPDRLKLDAAGRQWFPGDVWLFFDGKSWF